MDSLQMLYDRFRKSKGISIDSRTIVPGQIFFAIKGDRFDGNRYAEASLDKKAMLAVVDDPALKNLKGCLLVDNGLQTLQKLATLYRTALDLKVIAITGSNGKTTTKGLVAGVLGEIYNVHATKGNFNNHIGLPLTLLSAPEQTEIAVLEMGANHSGEIAELCRIAKPDFGLITNIGSAHLEGFGSLEGVKKGEGELYNYLIETGGTIFYNKDEPSLEGMQLGDRFFEYGNDEIILLETNQPYLEFALKGNENIVVKSLVYGSYNLPNICSAIAVGKFFKVPTDKIKSAIETFVPEGNRSTIVKRENNTFILDAYNANPHSMISAIDAFHTNFEGKKKVLVLGEMKELGTDSKAEHQRLLDYALNKGFEEILLIGESFNNRLPTDIITHFASIEDLKNWITSQNYTDTTFLLKGSRAMTLEKLLE